MPSPPSLPVITGLPGGQASLTNGGLHGAGGEQRANTAPAGSAYSSPSKKGSLGSPDTGGYAEPMRARAQTTSPPDTAYNDSAGYTATWPVPPQCNTPREVMQMVHNYWYPVEVSVRTRHPQRLEAALQLMHGTRYLRTIHTVRRSTGLKAAERHAIEMELAARLVRARAVLGKWKAGKREIKGAQDSRDADRLDKALGKWSFAEDDPEVARAKADLERWRTLAETLPEVLREAVERRDVEQIRKAVTELNASGPAGVEGEIGARKMLGKYDMQVKALHDAMGTNSAEAIETAMLSWTFDRDDPTMKEAQAMLQKREDQQKLLRAATDELDGPRLEKAVEEWKFEKDDNTFTQARAALNRYKHCSQVIKVMSTGRGNLPQLADVLNTWEFTNHDPVLHSAKGQIEAYEESVREALQRSDAWMLERLGTSGKEGLGRALPPSLQEEVNDCLSRYSETLEELQGLMCRAEDFSSAMEPAISWVVNSWSFSEDDPNLGCARLWLHLHKSAQVQSLHALRRANIAGEISSLQRMVESWQSLRSDACPEMKAAKDTCAAFSEALEVVGAVALGVEPGQLHGALERSHDLDMAMQNITRTVDSIQVRHISELKSEKKPPRIVHAVLETLLHALAGVSPHIREPPRDAEWRSCQKMVSNAAVFRANLLEVPNWVASGNLAGVRRARAVSQKFQAEFDDQWSFFGVRIKNAIAGQLFQYMEYVFQYVELIEANQGKQPKPPRHEVVAEGTADGKPMSALGSSADQSNFTYELDPKHLHPLSVLQQTRHCLSRSIVLAIAWVLSGNNPADLHNCLERKRKYLCSAEAAAAVARQELAHLAPLKAAHQDRNAASAVDPSDLEDAGAPVTDISLTVQLISGEVVTRIQVSSAATVAQLKEQIGAREGIPVKHQRILLGTGTLKDALPLRRQGVSDGACLTLIRLSLSLPERLQATAEELRLQATADDAAAFGNYMPVSGQGSPTAATPTAARPGSPTAVTPMAVTPRAATPTSATPRTARTGSPTATTPLAASATEVLPPEPAAHLLFGSGNPHLSAAPRKRPALKEMVRVLRAASAEIAATQTARNLDELCPSGLRASNLQAFSEPTRLNLEAIQSLRIPISNLAAARRAVDAGDCPAAVEKFVNIMHAFYNEFVPLRAGWIQALMAADEARQALRDAEEVVAIAASFKKMDRPPQTIDVEGVAKATKRSLEQAQVLAKQGLALPAVHVEYVRMAIDCAGAHLLANPPCADPATRIRWSEAAMAIQLAPLPHFGAALSAMARGIDLQDLQALSQGFEPVTECVRLLGAVIWVVQSDCRCNPAWSDIKHAISKPQDFVQSMVDWSPIRDTSVARITHARSLLLGIWGWVSSGCGGSKALGTVFAWVSLVVTLLPLSEMAQRLTPVYKAVKQGIAKSERAPPEQRFLAKAKAWTAALFLLDGPGEHWWWLRLIRPSAEMDMPWTDGEDGGVGEAHPHEVHVEDSSAGRWDPSGLRKSWKEGSAAHVPADPASPEDESCWEQELEEELDRDMVGTDMGEPDVGEPGKEVELTEEGEARAAASAGETSDVELAERRSSREPSETVAVDEEAPGSVTARGSPSPDAAELAAHDLQAAETAAAESPTGQSGA